MNEKKNKEKLKNHQPEILAVEVKEIPEQKPPNDKIISYNLNKKNKNILDKNDIISKSKEYKSRKLNS